MTSNDAVLRVIDAPNTLSIPYMLVGSYSSNLFGRTRSTNDADFVLQITGNRLSALAKALGPDFNLDRQMAFESVTMTTKHLIRCHSLPFTVELFLLSDDKHDQLRFSRRSFVDLYGHKVCLPTLEDVVIQKVRWANTGHRSKDLDDVKNVIAVSGALLDLDYVRHWTAIHGSRELFEQLLASVV